MGAEVSARVRSDVAYVGENEANERFSDESGTEAATRGVWSTGSMRSVKLDGNGDA
jgi:hypothetical protein